MAVRKWRFTTGISVLQSLPAGTDFWFLPSGTADGRRSYTIKEQWETVPAGETGFAARRAFESRIDTIVALTGRTGTLDVDFGETWVRSYQSIRFNGMRPIEASNNVMLKYDLEFEFPLPGQVARSLQFGLDADGDKLQVSGDNFVLAYDRENRHQFKYPFRAAPVRIAGGAGLKILRITSIKQNVINNTALERRQALEATIRNLSWTYKGQSRPLKVDGSFLESGALFQLQSISASDLSLPDSITFDLEFVTGYVE